MKPPRSTSGAEVPCDVSFEPTSRLSSWRGLARGTAEGRNLAWLSAERIVQLVVGLLIGAVVARHLGAPDYGRLALALAVVALLAPFMTAGDGLAVRDMESGVVPTPAVLGNTAVLVAGMTFAGASFLLLLSLVFPSFIPEGTRLLVLLVMAGPVLKPLAVVDYWFQAVLDAKRAALARNTSFLIGVAARVVAVLLDAPVPVFAAIIGAESVLSTTVLVLTYKRSGQDIGGWHLHREHLRGLFRQSFPLVLAGLSVALYMRIDQVMLGALSDAKQSGLYALGVMLSEVSWFLPVAAGTTLTPTMTRLWLRDREAYAQRLQHLFTLAAAGSYAVIAASLAVGLWFIPLAYGEQFRSTVPVFAVLVFATPFVFLGVMQSVWIVSAGQQKVALWRTAIGAVVNIVANLLVLPRYGAVGAGFTTVGSYAVAAVFANVLFAPTRPILRMQLRALCLRDARRVLRDPTTALRGEQ
jgi:PST family polysaccharide transporter